MMMMMVVVVDTRRGNCEWSSLFWMMSADRKEANTVKWIWSFLPSNSELSGWNGPIPWIVLKPMQRSMAHLSPTMVEAAWPKAAGMMPFWNHVPINVNCKDGGWLFLCGFFLGRPVPGTAGKGCHCRVVVLLINCGFQLLLLFQSIELWKKSTTAEWS